MNCDFNAIICIATLAAGAILFLDRVLHIQVSATAPTVPAGPGTATSAPLRMVRRAVVHHARALFPVLLVVAIARSFIFEPYRIPSDSMMPGLVHGDFILVDKFAYGLRWPIFNTKMIPTGSPHRGDVIVFRSPADPGTNLIKRLVGLPGDHIVVRDNRLTINGRLVPLSEDGTCDGRHGFAGSPLALETFGVADHVVLFAPDRWSKDFEGTVPPGHYFFMGDNRNDSEDSRFADVGFVPEANLIGHAHRIWMNWRLPGWPDWSRIGMKIR